MGSLSFVGCEDCQYWSYARGNHSGFLLREGIAGSKIHPVNNTMTSFWNASMNSWALFRFDAFGLAAAIQPSLSTRSNIGSFGSSYILAMSLVYMLAVALPVVNIQSARELAVGWVMWVEPILRWISCKIRLVPSCFLDDNVFDSSNFVLKLSVVSYVDVWHCCRSAMALWSSSWPNDLTRRRISSDFASSWYCPDW